MSRTELSKIPPIGSALKCCVGKTVYKICALVKYLNIKRCESEKWRAIFNIQLIKITSNINLIIALLIAVKDLYIKGHLNKIIGRGDLWGCFCCPHRLRS